MARARLLLVSILALLVPGTALAQLSFATAVSYAAGNEARQVRIADLNGDGRPDLIVLNQNTGGTGSVSIFLASGAAGNFVAGGTFAVQSEPEGIAVGDFNGDGRPDIAVANVVSGSVSILLATGAAGSFGTATSIALAGATAIATADFNGDGKLDLAVATANGALAILLGVGNGAFQSPQGYAQDVTASYRGIAVADLDGDGKLDIALCDFANNRVKIVLGDGLGAFADPPLVSTYPVGTHPRGIVAADFNGDGRPDLAVTNLASSSVSILMSLQPFFPERVAFGSAPSLATGLDPEDITAGNFDRDSNVDLVVASADNDRLDLFRGNGNGTFAASIPLTAGTRPHGVAVGDLDGDGRPDIAAANRGTDNVSVLISTSAVAPLPPTGVTAAPGDARATISFTPPTEPLSLPIIDYTVTCRSSGITIGSATGAASPIVVTGLINGILHDCTVRARNANGTGAPSAPASVRPQFASSVAVTTSASPVLVGESVTFTATPSSTEGAVTLFGFLHFRADGVTIGGCEFFNVTLTPTLRCTTSFATHGTKVITAHYTGTGSTGTTAGSIGTLPGGQVVNQVVTSVALSSSAPSVAAGAAITFTATITGSGPTGTVTFRSGGVTICDSVAVAAASAQCIATFPTAGTKVITADYSGDALNASSTGTLAGGQAVSLGTSSLALATSAATVFVNASVTFTATVTGLGPTGTVAFKAGGVAINGCTAVTLASGSVQCITSFASSGARVITADYSGDGANAAATGTLAGGQAVNKRTPSMTITSSKPSAFAFDTVTYTATVIGASPTGTIKFTDGVNGTIFDIPGCDAVALVAAKAQCTVTYDIGPSPVNRAGAHFIFGAYSGDAAHLPFDWQVIPPQIVDTLPTVTTVVTSAAPVTVGQSVTFTASTTSAGPFPAAGRIDFKADGTSIGGCIGITLAGDPRKATCTTTFATSGTKVITAVFSGNTAQSPSTGTLPGGQVVNAGGSSVALATSRSPSPVGASVTFTATVSPSSATGTVNFKDGGTSLAGCGAVVLASGIAQCTTIFSSAGTKAITADYSGDASNAPATGVLTPAQVVEKAATSTTLATSAAPVKAGTPVTFTATVSPSSATGPVNFKDGGASIAGCAAVALASGAAQCTTAFATPGTRTITAEYAGDASFNASTATLAGGQAVTAAQNSFTGATATGTGTATVSFTGGGPACSFAPQGNGAMESAFFIPVSGHPKSPPAGSAPAVPFPQGLLDFVLLDCTPGATISFIVSYPTSLPAGAQYWKYGPTASNTAPHWYVLPAAISGSTVTFSITDGGAGDDDLTANGIVVDQGGPGGPSTSDLRPVPTLSEWAMILLVLLTGVVGAWRLRVTPPAAGRWRR